MGGVERMKKELDAVSKAFLQDMRVNPAFRSAMKFIAENHRPVVPAYKSAQTKEEEFAMLERIKFESGRQEGFDLVYLLLTGEKPNE